MSKEFSKEELELLAHGFGFFVQESPLPEELTSLRFGLRTRPRSGDICPHHQPHRIKQRVGKSR